MLSTILLIVVVIVAVALGLAAMRSNNFLVERQAFIAAKPDKVLPLIADFHQWALWSPWEKMDPQMSRSYSGAASGAGAIYAWQGNKKVGQGPHGNS